MKSNTYVRRAACDLCYFTLTQVGDRVQVTPLPLAEEYEGELEIAGTVAEVAKQLQAWPVIEPNPKVLTSFAEEFAEVFGRVNTLERAVVAQQDDSVVEAIEELYGVRAQGDLRQHLRLRSVPARWPRVGEWRIWGDDLLPVDRSEGENTFEQVLSSFSAYSLHMLLCDAIQIGTAGNGDCYWAVPTVGEPYATPVFFFDHETDEVSLFADSIATLGVLNHLYVVDDGTIEVEDPKSFLRERGRWIAKRVNPSWHYRSVCENAPIDGGGYEVATLPTEYFYALGAWVVALLKGDVESAIRRFHHKAHANRCADYAGASKYSSFLWPSRALYWLTSLWVFDDEHFDAALTRCAESPSRWVRDAVSSFRALQTGATHLCGVPLAELKVKFREGVLARDPERVEREKKERQARLEQTRVELADADEAVVFETIWTQLHQPEVVQACVEKLVQNAPSLAAPFEVARGAASGELEECVRQLGEAGAVGRMLLVAALSVAGPHQALACVRVLYDDERARLVQNEALMQRWARWVYGKYGAEVGIELQHALGRLDDAMLCGLIDRYDWSRTEEEDEDDAEDDESDANAENAAALAAFGPLAYTLVDPPVKAEEPEEDEEDEDESEGDESDDDDEDSDDESEDEESEDDEDSDDESEDEESEDEESDDDDESEEEESDDDEESDDEESDDEPEESANAPWAPCALELLDPSTTPPYPSIHFRDPLGELIRLAGRERREKERLLALWRAPLREVKEDLLAALGHFVGDPEARAVLREALRGQYMQSARSALLAWTDDAEVQAEVLALLPPWQGLAPFAAQGVVARAALGAEMPVEAIEQALYVTLPKAAATATMHVDALRWLATHARERGVELRPVVRTFLDEPAADVRDAAVTALRAFGEEVSPRSFGDVEALCARGPAAIAAVLDDEESLGKERIFDALHGQALDPIVAAALRRWVGRAAARRRYYAGTYVSDKDEAFDSAICTLFHDRTEETRALLASLLASSNPLHRKAFEYQNEVCEWLGAQRAADVLDTIAGRDLSAGVTLERLGGVPFALGAPVHGIAYLGDHVVIVGGGASAIFDRAGGRDTSRPLTAGWAYDVDVSPDQSRFVITYSHGHCIVYDAKTATKITDLSHGGAGVRKVKYAPSGRWFATANDDRTLRIFDALTLECTLQQSLSHDVNGVDWIDDERLVYQTDTSVGVLTRDGALVREINAGGAEVVVVGDEIFASGKKRGLLVLSHTLDVLASYPIHDVARVRVAHEGALVVASWTCGGSRVDRASGAITKLTDEELFALACDPRDGSFLFGGKSARATRLDPSGVIVPSAAADTDGPMPPRNAVGFEPELQVGDVRTKVAASVIGDDGITVAIVERAVCAVDAHGTLLWRRSLQRSQRVLVFGDVVVVPSGKALGFLRRSNGELIEAVPTSVASGWVHYLEALDDEHFLLMGYDDAVLQRWSVTTRRPTHRHTIQGHRRERFERPYGLAVDRQAQQVWICHWDSVIDGYDVGAQGYTRRMQLAMAQPMEWLSVSGDRLLAANAQSVYAFDKHTAAPLFRASLPDKQVAMVADGDVVWLAGADGSRTRVIWTNAK